jgi:hypothetical protein
MAALPSAPARPTPPLNPPLPAPNTNTRAAIPPLAFRDKRLENP